MDFSLPTRQPPPSPQPLVSAGHIPGDAGAVASAPESPPSVSVASYYAPAQGRRGADLLRTLHLLSEQHHQPLSYAQARAAMFETIEDPRGDNVITDLYSGLRISSVTGLATATSAGLTAEHVWPQSEGATQEARGDLHHLRPALRALNSHRSNLPYGDVVDPIWASPAVHGVRELSLVGADAKGHTVFAPRASIRGDLARDQFYFFTRYQSTPSDASGPPAGFSLDNFRASLPTLLRWSREDPVDDPERARNEAIAALQGNRNPFVDHPGYIDRIGFDQRLLGRRAANDSSSD